MQGLSGLGRLSQSPGYSLGQTWSTLVKLSPSLVEHGQTPTKLGQTLVKPCCTCRYSDIVQRGKIVKEEDILYHNKDAFKLQPVRNKMPSLLFICKNFSGLVPAALLTTLRPPLTPPFPPLSPRPPRCPPTQHGASTLRVAPPASRPYGC